MPIVDHPTEAKIFMKYIVQVFLNEKGSIKEAKIVDLEILNDKTNRQ